MPARDSTYWEARQESQCENASPCHYQEYWQDLYATGMRRRGMERLFTALPRAEDDRALRVLDVGCGDGRFGAWVARRFDVAVSGIDCYAWGAYDRLRRFARIDAENAAQVVKKWGHFDAAMLVTVLPFVASAERVLEELTHVAPYLLVLDNFQDPAPAWQTRLSYKRHIPLWDFFAMASAAGYVMEETYPVNVLDRALFVHAPRVLYPFAYLATMLGEKLALWSIEHGRLNVRHARYFAVLLKNGKWSELQARRLCAQKVF